MEVRPWWSSVAWVADREMIDDINFSWVGACRSWKDSVVTVGAVEFLCRLCFVCDGSFLSFCRGV